MSIKKDILLYTKIVYFIFVVAAICIVIQIISIQLFNGEMYKKIAKENTYKNISIPADRGNIYAKDGRLLACSIPYYQLFLDCKLAHDSIYNNKIDSLSDCLSKYFKDRSKREYYRLLKAARGTGRVKPNRYLMINRRELSYQELEEVKKFPIFRLSSNVGGLIIKKIDKRIQPHKNLASRTIGTVRESEVAGMEGQVGLEGSYELDLKGKPGIGIKQKMIGSWLPFSTIDPIDGNDIYTTIDVNFQDIAETALEQQLRKYEAESGAIILMEVKTGAIRAIANLGRSNNGSHYWEDYNHAIGDSREYGSIFKLASMIAVLEDGYVTAKDTINTWKGRYKFYDRTMIDSHSGGYGNITIQEAFEKSSNVGISRIIDKYYKKRPSDFVNRLYSMGLNNKLGISILGEGRPVIKYPGDAGWSGTTLPWMSIGYEIHITPLQILTFYNAVANDGIMVKPMFVEEIRSRTGIVHKMEKEILMSSFCSNNTLNTVKSMLEGVVERGTAINIKSDEYKIAGKTGTSLISEKEVGYSNKKYISSFVGYFPADKPVYSCVVVVFNPNKNIGFYGSTVAAPVFRALADKVYAQTYYLHKQSKRDNNSKGKVFVMNGNKNEIQYLASELGIKFDNEYCKYDWVRIDDRNNVFKYNDNIISDNFVPNVEGMCLRDAIYLLENIGLSVSYSGVGKIVSQSIKAGTLVRDRQLINITLQ